MNDEMKKLVERRAELKKAAPYPDSPLSSAEYTQNELEMVDLFDDDQALGYCEKRYPEALGILKAQETIEAKRAFLAWCIFDARWNLVQRGAEVAWQHEVLARGSRGGVTVEGVDPSPPEEEEAMRQVVIRSLSKKPVTIERLTKLLVAKFGGESEAWSSEFKVRARVQGVIARFRANPNGMVVEDHPDEKVLLKEEGASRNRT